MKILILSTFVFMFGSLAQAQSVLRIQNKKVLMDFPEPPAVGERFYTVNSAGKKTAIIVIKLVRGKRAQGEITKGRAQVGMSLVPLRSQGGPSTASSFQALRPWSYGGFFGYNMDSISLTATDQYGSFAQSLKMTGSSYAFGGFVDYHFNKVLVGRGALAYDGFSAKASSSPLLTGSCSGQTTCTIDHKYLAFSGYGLLYVMDSSSFRLGLGLGYTFDYVLSGTSNVGNMVSISSNQSVNGLVEGDIYLNRKMFVPLMFEYKYFISQAGITTSSMSLKAGFGLRF